MTKYFDLAGYKELKKLEINQLNSIHLSQKLMKILIFALVRIISTYWNLILEFKIIKCMFSCKSTCV